MINDNIAAISTALMPSGVAVIRISGSSPLKIAEKMFKPQGKTAVCDFTPNMMYAGEIYADGFSDFGLCVYFKGPKSFTGEDIVEFHSHGGVAISQGILKKILSLGVRLADRGEFTKRAFLNGKLSLASSEGLIDMINSQSIAGVRAGYSLYREKLTKDIIACQDKLTDAISEIDADMDFPEEDLEQLSLDTVRKNLTEVNEELDKKIASYRTGRVIKNGVKVGIVGKPNTGKSSLLNALLNYQKAIVSDVAGTTRDIVEGSIDINGLTFRFSDTAGIRDADDTIEEMGVKMSKKVLDESDIVLFVLDADDITTEDEEIYQMVKDYDTVIAVNKTDKSKKEYEHADVYISAKTLDNVEKLKELLFDRATKNVDVNGEFLTEERHLDALKRARQKINEGLASLGIVPLDMVAIDIKDAWDALGEISGKTATEEIINNIFSKFCVGK